MNDELQPTNHPEACAKDHGHVTGPVDGVEADGTAKQAKSKQKSEREVLKATADTAEHKAVSLAAPAEATKAVSPQAGCQVNKAHPQSPMARWRPAASPLAHRDRRGLALQP